MKGEPKNNNVIFQSGDVDVFADNTQRKGKTNRVKENGITPLGIATNVVSIQSNPLSSIQYIENFPPVNWFSKTTDCVNEIKKQRENLHCVARKNKSYHRSVFENITRIWHSTTIRDLGAIFYKIGFSR